MSIPERDPGRDVEDVLAELGMERASQEEIDRGWDSMAAMIARSTDEELRATRPGISDEAIARWRHLAASPVLPKMATDFWYSVPAKPQNLALWDAVRGRGPGDEPETGA